MLLDLLQQRMIDRLAAGGGGLVGVKRLAGAGEPPDLLGDAMHVHREADPAVANQSETQFLLAHQWLSSSAQIGR